MSEANARARAAERLVLLLERGLSEDAAERRLEELVLCALRRSERRPTPRRAPG